MDKIKIEKGIKIPPKRGGINWAEMAVGDSFFVKAGKEAEAISKTVYSQGKKLNMKFTIRTVPGGKRVWRIA